MTDDEPPIWRVPAEKQYDRQRVILAYVRLTLGFAFCSPLGLLFLAWIGIDIGEDWVIVWEYCGISGKIYCGFIVCCTAVGLLIASFRPK